MSDALRPSSLARLLDRLSRVRSGLIEISIANRGFDTTSGSRPVDLPR
jgi:hypothetical protein